MKFWTPVAAALLIFAGSTTIFGQDAKPKADDLDQSLFKIERELSDALVKRDMPVFEKYIADTCTSTDMDSEVMDKERLLKFLGSPRLTIRSSKLDDLKAKVYGDCAIVTYKSTDAGTFKGEAFDSQVRWTDTFVKLNGKWQIVASHGSRIAN
ncbi:MAG: nuclear transport factor 2 family protein [Chthonomonadales bacterium]